MNLAGVVILYNPDDKLIQRINSYKSFVKQLYVFDNSFQFNKGLLQPLIEDRQVLYFYDGINEGISKRLNQAAHKAIDDGYDWLLTMDQDSSFDQEALDQYLCRACRFKNNQQVAMFGIEYDKRFVSNSETLTYKSVSHLITSGSLLNLSLFPKIGCFDEMLFIDHVDHEYCFNAISKGYEIIKFDCVPLNHSLGLVSNYRSLKNFKVTPRALHSPIRLYYMVRNYFYLNSKYKAFFPAEMEAFKKHLFNRIKNNLLYNEQRLCVVKYIIRGYQDFKMGKMGKLI